MRPATGPTATGEEPRSSLHSTMPPRSAAYWEARRATATRKTAQHEARFAAVRANNERRKRAAAVERQALALVAAVRAAPVTAASGADKRSYLALDPPPPAAASVSRPAAAAALAAGGGSRGEGALPEASVGFAQPAPAPAPAPPRAAAGDDEAGCGASAVDPHLAEGLLNEANEMPPALAATLVQSAVEALRTHGEFLRGLHGQRRHDGRDRRGGAGEHRRARVWHVMALRGEEAPRRWLQRAAWRPCRVARAARCARLACAGGSERHVARLPTSRAPSRAPRLPVELGLRSPPPPGSLVRKAAQARACTSHTQNESRLWRLEGLAVSARAQCFLRFIRPLFPPVRHRH
jgi:hypothetical protein